MEYLGGGVLVLVIGVLMVAIILLVGIYHVFIESG